MRSEFSGPLPDYVLALPGLLHGNLGQALEIALAVKADRYGLLSCEFAETLLLKEMRQGNSCSVLERARIAKIQKLSGRWLRLNYMSRSLAAWKVNFACSVASAASFFCEPESFALALVKCRVYLLMIWDRCQKAEIGREAENVA